MKIRSLVALSMVASLGLAIAHAADASTDTSKAKITMSQAEAAALKVFPGTIVKKELEKEKGGSGLRYSFDIKNGKVVHEVGIDAVTGAVLENSVDND